MTTHTLGQLTGADVINGSGGGETKFLAADGTWVAPYAPSKPQIVTTRNGISNGITKNISANAGLSRQIESRVKMYVGPQPVAQLQIGLCGYTISSSGEAILGNDYDCEVALENISPSTYQEGFYPSGVYGSVPNGSPLTLNNPIVGYDFSAGSSFWFRMRSAVPFSCYYLPFVSYAVATGDACYASPSTASQIPGTGVLSVPSGGQSANPQYPLILGIPAAPMPAVIILGDSIADGYGDQLAPSTLGSAGFIQRGLESVGGGSYPLPWHKQSVSGIGLSTYSVDLCPRIRSHWQYCTHMIIEAATNNIIAGPTLATMQGYLTAVVNSAKRVVGPYGKRPQIWVTTVFPRTTSTDSWQTAVNQTALNSNYAIGGLRDTYNAWIKTQVGTLIDGVIDVNPYVEDQLNLGKWITTGAANYATQDGTHPTTAASILAAQAVNTAALTFTP